VGWAIAVVPASFLSFDFIIPVLLDLLTIFFVVASLLLLWLNLRGWRRKRVVITPENYDSVDRKDRSAQLPRDAESLMPWSTPFDDPIDLPDGRKLMTLRDAAAYIAELPEAEQQAEEWQTAARCLIDTANGSNLMMHARIVMLRASGKPELKRDE
jgi:hypothetical protein